MTTKRRQVFVNNFHIFYHLVPFRGGQNVR
nr:MAG TPA: SMOOTH MUSCLE MYOSIN HEAVY CHAIN/SMOOTH protein, smooth muscle, myosin.0A [Caudoviricetes sp.]